MEKCDKCGSDRLEPIVETTGYIHRSYEGVRAYGGGHGSATLKGWHCLACGETRIFGLA